MTGVSSAAATGADLFSSTIQWENPNCTSTSTPTNYFWYCPAGTAWSSPPETCDATNDGMPSAARTCCRPVVNTPTFAPAVGHGYQYFTAPVPPGPPYPAMTGPAGEVCTSIFSTGNTSSTTGAPCTVPVLISDDPPYEVPCPPGGGEVCYFDPPPVYTPSVCTTYTTYQWGCQYDYTRSQRTTTRARYHSAVLRQQPWHTGLYWIFCADTHFGRQVRQRAIGRPRAMSCMTVRRPGLQPRSAI